MDELNKILEQLSLANEIIAYGDNVEQSPSFMSIKEFPMMLNEILSQINENPNNISARDLIEFIVALKNMSERIKPIYIRMLACKEARDANK